MSSPPDRLDDVVVHACYRSCVPTAGDDPAWPCKLIRSEDGKTHSLCLFELDRLAHHFGEDAGGYAVDGLVRKLVRAREPKLLKRFQFDSEASMFCIFGPDRETLLAVARLLREVADGDADPSRRRPAERRPFDESAAARLLARGFVLDLDVDAQREFYALVERPMITPEQQERLNKLAAPDPTVRRKVGRRILDEACGLVGSWTSYLSDPRISGLVIDKLVREQDRPVRRELLLLLRMICHRHLPDLRARTIFEEGLRDPSAEWRSIAASGYGQLYRPSWQRLGPLLADRSARVRAEVLGQLAIHFRPFKTWFLTEDLPNDPFPGDMVPLVAKALDDRDGEVRIRAARVIGEVGGPDALPLLEKAARRERRMVAKETFAGAVGRLRERHGVKKTRGS